MTVDDFVEVLLDFNSIGQTLKADDFEDSHESALETLQVPVLIDDLVNDSGLENLLRFVGEQEHQVPLRKIGGI